MLAFSSYCYVYKFFLKVHRIVSWVFSYAGKVILKSMTSLVLLFNKLVMKVMRSLDLQVYLVDVFTWLEKMAQQDGSTRSKIQLSIPLDRWFVQ